MTHQNTSAGRFPLWQFNRRSISRPGLRGSQTDPYHVILKVRSRPVWVNCVFMPDRSRQDGASLGFTSARRANVKSVVKNCEIPIDYSEWPNIFYKLPWYIKMTILHTVRTAGLLAGIWTQYLLNTKQECWPLYNYILIYAFWHSNSANCITHLARNPASHYY